MEPDITPIAAMQDYYCQRADVYDQSMGYDRQSTIDTLQPVIDFLCEQFADKDVLELACGPAFWTSFVGRHAKSIIATDYSEETLREARKKAFDGNRVRFQQADAYALPPFPALFTGCFSVDWISHIPKQRFSRFLAGVHRCLSPGATVAFCDQLPRDSSLTGQFDEQGNHLQSRSLPDGSIHTVIKNFFPQEEIAALLAPCATEIAYHAFPQCRRFVVTYTPRACQAD